MNLVESYFFTNNIEVLGVEKRDNGTYWITDTGLYFVRKSNPFKLDKIDGRVVEKSIYLNKEEDDDPEILTAERRQSMLLKMAYDAMISARMDVYNLKKKKIYSEGHLHWKLIEAQKRESEFSQFYNDLIQSRWVLKEEVSQ